MAATILVLALALSSVHVNIDQDGGLSAGQLRIVIDQMQQIWHDAGVDLTAGRHGEPAEPGAAAVSLRIVRLTVPPNSKGAPILAWTAVGASGLPEPVLILSLPAITALVSDTEFAGAAFKRLTDDVRDELIARAVGRAAAHELGHYLLEKSGHRPGGLMRPSYSARDLVGAWLHPFQVSADEQPLVRAEIAALARVQSGLW